MYYACRCWWSWISMPKSEYSWYFLSKIHQQFPVALCWFIIISIASLLLLSLRYSTYITLGSGTGLFNWWATSPPSHTLTYWTISYLIYKWGSSTVLPLWIWAYLAVAWLRGKSHFAKPLTSLTGATLLDAI